MITIGLLNWTDSPVNHAPVVTIPLNFATDQNYTVGLRGSYHDSLIYAQVVTVDNTQNNANVTVTINGVAVQISANTRSNVPIASGILFLLATATGGTTTLNFYGNEKDAPNDQPNYIALIQQTVNATLPAGVMFAYGGSIAPSGYFICDGTAISRTTYAILFSLIGTAYGIGDGVNTFNLPDLRDRVPIGVSPGGLAGSRPTARAIGATGGEETHQLTVAELASHAHTAVVGGVQNPCFATTAAVSFGGAASATNSQGGDAAHNNMQPFAVVNWIIRTGL